MNQESFVSAPRVLCEVTAASQWGVAWATASRRFRGFVNPSFKDFVNSTDEVHSGSRLPLNREGLFKRSKPRFVDVSILNNNAIQRGNVDDLSDYVDNNRADAAS